MENNLISRASFSRIKLIAILGVMLLATSKISVAEEIHAGVSFQVFYDELMPYGDWISHPVHGYVWVPYAEPGFQPYATNGYWVMSTYGNTWVSDYEWGWAPFHYGRWYFDDYLGWAWVPGYEWGPAWVNWRTGGNYYGWAPLMPGVSIHVSVNIPTHYWVFVPKKRLISRNVYHYYVPRRNVTKIYNQTTIINNTYVYNNNTYVSGPARREVERVTRRTVPVYQVSNSERPGRTSLSRNTLQVYQPAVRRVADNGDAQARPARVVNANEHKANVASRSRSEVQRTAPANSRANSTNSRTSDARTAEPTRRVESRPAATPSRTENQSSTGAATPSRKTRDQGDAKGTVSQPREASQPRNAATSRQQQPASATPRTQAPQQRQAAPAKQPSVQRDAGSRTREVSRSSSTPRVNSGAATQRKAEGSSSTSSQRTSQSRSSRGNN